MEWRDTKRYGPECERILQRELAMHFARDWGPARTIDDADRVALERQESFAAAVARVRAQSAAVRLKLRKRLTRKSHFGAG